MQLCFVGQKGSKRGLWNQKASSDNDLFCKATSKLRSNELFSNVLQPFRTRKL